MEVNIRPVCVTIDLARDSIGTTDTVGKYSDISHKSGFYGLEAMSRT